MKRDADDLVQSLENFLAIAPNGEILRLYVGDKFDDAKMPPEEFVAFARELLIVARKIRERG